MINGSVYHLVGLSLVKDGVKGRVISVRVEGCATSVEVVTEAGAFAMWRLHQCVEAEPGALVRAIEEVSESIDRILGKTKPAEPPLVEEPTKPSLVWTQGTHPDMWNLVVEGCDDWCYVSWSHIGPRSYAECGAKKTREADPGTQHNGCKTIAAWAREDGYAVPPHPVYGEV